MKYLLICLGVLLYCHDSHGQMISEFQPNPPGGDPANASFEISGTPSTSFSGWVVSIENDNDSGLGTIERATQVSGMFDANGLLVVSIPDLENPSFTVALVDNFTGTVGITDIDTNNDGIPDDVSTLGTIYDAIGVPDIAGDVAISFGDDLGGETFEYTGDEPQLVFREGSTGAWFAVNDPIGSNVYDINDTAVPLTDFSPDPSVTTFGSINPSRTVPVKLASFDAHLRDAQVYLAWTTDSEINNDRFVIERSLDRVNYQNIGVVRGHGNTSTKVDYSFIDRQPSSGINYYRLVQHDHNGAMEYHKTIAVKMIRKTTSVYPSRVLSTVNIDLPEPANISIYDQRGKLLLHRKLSSSSEIELSELVPGSYVMVITTRSQSDTHRIVKL